MVEFTEDDVGKQLVTANQDPLGEITEVEDGTAWVDPNEQTLGEGELLFGWSESDVDGRDSVGTAPVPEEAVQLATDDAVVLIEQLEVSFQQENVLPDDEHQYSFYGSYGYLKDGQVHLVNRKFHVYTDEEYLGDGGKPLTEVIESHHVETSGEEDRHTVDESTTEVIVDVETDIPERVEEGEIEEFLGGWHVTHAERK